MMHERPAGAQAAIERSNAAFLAGDPDSAAEELVAALRRTTPADRRFLVSAMLRTLEERAARPS